MKLLIDSFAITFSRRILYKFLKALIFVILFGLLEFFDYVSFLIISYLTLDDIQEFINSFTDITSLIIILLCFQLIPDPWLKGWNSVSICWLTFFIKFLSYALFVYVKPLSDPFLPQFDFLLWHFNIFISWFWFLASCRLFNQFFLLFFIQNILLFILNLLVALIQSLSAYFIPTLWSLFSWAIPTIQVTNFL